MQLENSYAWWERAGHVLAGGFATLSKNPDRFPFGVAPIVLASGDGCHVVDVDGNTFLDTIGALGPVLFGYGWPSIESAVIEAVTNYGGPAFSLGHHLEIEVAEAIAANILPIDTVRFCKNGADATQAAVRVARSKTGRNHILACGYHGHHDWYISTTDKDGGIVYGVSKYTHQFAWDDYDKFNALIMQYDKYIAGIIVEIPPLLWNASNQDDHIIDFLEHMIDIASRRGIVFILDEVVTGFRYGIGGASALYGINPDLICLGKGLANGYPLAAIGGDRNLMSEFNGGNVFLSTTNGGDVISLAAAKACISDLEDSRHLAQLWDCGQQLGDGFNGVIEIFDLPVELLGNSARMVMKWRDHGEISGDAIKTLFLQEAISQGVLFGGPIFPTVMMQQQDVSKILDAAAVAARTIQEALHGDKDFMDFLRCPVIEDVFSKRYRPMDKASALSGA